MEATFVMKPDELTPEWLEQLKDQFAQDGTITIKATGPEKPLSVEQQRTATQRAMFERIREIQKKHPPKQIAANVDINELIDELNWEGNH